MKKWLIFAAIVAILAGCGSDKIKETSDTEKSTSSTTKTEVSTSKTEQSSSNKGIEMKDVDFQIAGTAYKMKILDSWQISPEKEDVALSAEEGWTPEGIVVFGMKKTDFDGLDSFKNLMKEQMTSTEDILIKEETKKAEVYQTSHYAGEQFSFMTVSDGMNVEFRYYFLETETDYVAISFFVRPSFFTKNLVLFTEMLNSFKAGYFNY